MYTSFIPSWHFTNPTEKLKTDWCWKAVQWCWYQTRNYNLLEGKNVQEINGYATGDFDLTEFKRMYKSQAKKMDAEKQGFYDTRNMNGFKTEMGYVPLPLIPTKLNSAIAIVQKIPVEVSVTAQDPLAVKKKQEDIAFLKNKPALEGQLQALADQMQIGDVDLGTTAHSAVEFSSSPYGLDLSEPDELQVFVDLLYNLGVETAFETALQQFEDIKQGSQIKLLNITDQLYYGVSSFKVFQSAITSLPDIAYTFPGSISTPYSKLPDLSDNTHRFIEDKISVIDLFNAFGDEICNEETLRTIINGEEFGYCACNNLKFVDEKNTSAFNNFKVDLLYCEIKSVDSVSVAPLNKKSRFTYLVTEPEEAAKCENKVWGQNTYGFYWLKNTKYFFKIDKLPYALREVGKESMQNFSSIIYRSQAKSAVEQSIGENKKAQIADIKQQHAIIKSLPSGKYVDLKYLRGVIGGLTDDGNKWTQQDLINLFMEQNIMIGDTEGFEGKNDGQLKPFVEIVGGLKIAEIAGYAQVIIDAKNKISEFTGINDQLTGQSANPEGLIGLQKLLINSSINALYYINLSVEQQQKAKFAIWATIIKEAIKQGGKAKQAIIDLIGAKKVSLIQYLDDVPLHTMGLKVEVKQREEEIAEFKNEITRLKNLGVITVVDEYRLSGITNPKDRIALLAVVVKQWEKKQDKLRQEQFANQQAIVEQQGANQQAVVKGKVEGDIQKVYAQGDVSSKILELAAQLGIQASQLDGLIKKSLQQDRGNDQLDKSIKTLETKQVLENQQAFKQ